MSDSAEDKTGISFDVGYPYTDEHDMFVVAEGCAFDSEGNGPYHWSDGCPNCQEGRGWTGLINLVAVANSTGFEVGAPLACSRKCALQLEYAAELAAREVSA